MAPAVVTLKLVELMYLEAGSLLKLIPLLMVAEPKVMPLVIPPEIAPELVMRSASATTVEPVEFVSALSSKRSAFTELSVVLVVAWFWIWATYSVLPATVGVLVNLRFKPVYVVALVPADSVRSNVIPFEVDAAPVGVEVAEKFASEPVVRDVLASARVLPVVEPGLIVKLAFPVTAEVPLK